MAVIAFAFINLWFALCQILYSDVLFMAGGVQVIIVYPCNCTEIQEDPTKLYIDETNYHIVIGFFFFV